MLFLLMISTTFGQLLKRSRHKYLQEAGLTVLIGAVAGFILSYLKVTMYIKNLTGHFSGIFLILLLPPIIFESGYNMNKKSFFKNLGTVLLFSFVGTFIAIFSSSVMFWIIGKTPLSPDFTWKESFAFGSLISATDPVSVLASFKEMNANADLYAIIFGESIFNDAVAIVMYQTVILAGNSEISASRELFNGLWQFTVIFVGSLMVGALSALVISF